MLVLIYASPETEVREEYAERRNPSTKLNF